MNVRFKTIFVAAGFLLAGCSGNTREILGIHRQSPDEFRVVSNPPLSMPPDFAVRPPKEMAEAASVEYTADNKKIVFEKASSHLSVAEPDRLTQGERSFLDLAGTENSDPKIKELLEQEAKQAEEAKANEKGFFSKMTAKITGKEDEKSLVDAGKERKRIIENEKDGKPVTEGETPTTSGDSGGILNKVF